MSQNQVFVTTVQLEIFFPEKMARCRNKWNYLYIWNVFVICLTRDRSHCSLSSHGKTKKWAFQNDSIVLILTSTLCPSQFVKQKGTFSCFGLRSCTLSWGKDVSTEINNTLMRLLEEFISDLQFRKRLLIITTETNFWKGHRSLLPCLLIQLLQKQVTRNFGIKLLNK